MVRVEEKVKPFRIRKIFHLSRDITWSVRVVGRNHLIVEFRLEQSRCDVNERDTSIIKLRKGSGLVKGELIKL